MPDSQHPRNNQHASPEEPAALLRDLRAMPRVSAPMDFQEHLRRRIDDMESAQPWWKRALAWRPSWGFGIPGYAYGAVATVFLAVFAVYLFNSTDVERELRRQTAPIEKSQDILHEQAEIPGEGESTGPSAAAGQDDAADADETDAPAQRNARDLQPAVPIPTPSSEEPADAGGRSANDAAEQRLDSYAPAIRGFMKEEELGAIPDSIAKKDSVRILDSLKSFQNDRQRTPENDPR